MVVEIELLDATSEDSAADLPAAAAAAAVSYYYHRFPSCCSRRVPITLRLRFPGPSFRPPSTVVYHLSSFLNGTVNLLFIPSYSPPIPLPPACHHSRSNHLPHHVTPLCYAPITSRLRVFPSSTFFLRWFYSHRPSSSSHPHTSPKN